MSRKTPWATCFVMHRLEMLLSSAWQLAPRPVRNILERLEIEHLRHGGYKNGELYVAYSQFKKCGVSPRAIKPALDAGAALGLLEVTYSEHTGGSIRPPNAYRLTYIPVGKKAPTDEWKSVSEDQAQRIVQEFKSSVTGGAKSARREAA